MHYCIIYLKYVSVVYSSVKCPQYGSMYAEGGLAGVLDDALRIEMTPLGWRDTPKAVD